MRQTKHRRRFHTDRVVRNRQRRMRREGTFWWKENPLADGYLEDVDWYHGCRRAHCLLCHWDKFMEPRRAREKRVWEKEAVAEVERYCQDS